MVTQNEGDAGPSEGMQGQVRGMQGQEGCFERCQGLGSSRLSVARVEAQGKRKAASRTLWVSTWGQEHTCSEAIP